MRATLIMGLVKTRLRKPQFREVSSTSLEYRPLVRRLPSFQNTRAMQPKGSVNTLAGNRLLKNVQAMHAMPSVSSLYGKQRF